VRGKDIAIVLRKNKIENPTKNTVLQTSQETLTFVDWLVLILNQRFWFSCRKMSFQALFLEQDLEL